MRWRDLDLEAARLDRAGRRHEVGPGASSAAAAAGRPAILEWLPRLASSTSFPGRGGRPMTGWSQAPAGRLQGDRRGRHGALDAARSAQDHAHRARPAGVDRVVSELLLNHAISRRAGRDLRSRRLLATAGRGRRALGRPCHGLVEAARQGRAACALQESCYAIEMAVLAARVWLNARAKIC